MAIVRMKRLGLLGMRPDRDRLLNALQRLGCAQVAEPDVDPEDELWAALAKPDGQALDRARQEDDLLRRALAVLKRYDRPKGGALTPRPAISADQLFDPGALFWLRRVSSKL